MVQCLLIWGAAAVTLIGTVEILWAIKVLRPFLQFSMIILSFWVSLTRMSDYFHHPLHVIMGAIVGITKKS